MKARINKDTFLENFIKERNEALFSLNEEKIKAYFKKYKINIPENPIVFWGAVYKAKAWLGEHGMSTEF